MTNKELIDNGIHAIYALDTFVKIKAAFNIDKMVFCFVNTKTGHSIDYYMSVKKFALFMKRVKAGIIRKQLQESKAADPDGFPKAIKTWAGKSKTMDLAPGKKTEIVFTCNKFEDKNNKITIRVGGEYDELEELLIVCEPLIEEYMVTTYTLSNVANSYFDNKAKEAEADELLYGNSENSEQGKSQDKPLNGANTPKEEEMKNSPARTEKNENKAKSELKTVVLNVVTTSSIRERIGTPGDYSFTAVDYNNKNIVYRVVIPASAIAKMKTGVWEKMVERSVNPMDFKFVATLKKEGSVDVHYFQKFA